MECADAHKPTGHIILWAKTLKYNLWGFVQTFSALSLLRSSSELQLKAYS